MNISTDRLVRIFFDLISISAVAKQEKPVAEYIRSFLSEADIDVQEDHSGNIVGGDTGNLIARVYHRETEPIPLAFLSHMDTVKPTQGIKPKLLDGRITTDGNTILGADNRAGIAIILYTIEYLKKNKIPHRAFEVVFTIGEETGLYGSTNIDLDLLESRVAYILDSSASPGYFVYAAPSALDIRVSLIGKASHAGVQPEEGINAISMAGNLIHHFPVGRVDEETTINFGLIQGGEATNVVPPHVTLTGEIRSFNKQRIGEYQILLQTHLNNIKKMFGGDFHFHAEEAFPGFSLDLQSHPIQYLSQAYKNIGIEPKPIPYHGGSDANVLNNRGITAIDLGIGAKNPHSNSEYIMVKDMELIVRLLHQLTKI